MNATESLIAHHAPITIIEYVNYFNFLEFGLFTMHMKILGKLKAPVKAS